MPKLIVAYYRVSTDRQGIRGLGIEAQQAAVEQYARQMGAEILADYREAESGRKSDRPQLREALRHARRSGAVLVVEKLDRLSRNLAFLSALMEAKVDFVCCDNPNANQLTLHILAAVAEDEAVSPHYSSPGSSQRSESKWPLNGDLRRAARGRPPPRGS